MIDCWLGALAWVAGVRFLRLRVSIGDENAPPYITTHEGASVAWVKPD
jgi:hypothetical protein